ncbi:hypothetical protein GGTG_06942 [Gaeumannomyces tritici R3-111a-1]|uniref:Uncharacterized protein n=1 Tax=Gaeumannomyces tritici (strain R3-111a-1) TaxID=644352 RepID=J3P095_GAET3|nr:hypothetical protein GGTG_06942 [Gaeumannomyces tritici R3-111a-1]EJT77028.1 hypothetical protein GGTG_06942 [Gaeumannomyces tritici R3-111a-1]
MACGQYVRALIGRAGRGRFKGNAVDDDRGGKPCRRQAAWRGVAIAPFESHEAGPEGVAPGRTVSRKKGKERREREGKKQKTRVPKQGCPGGLPGSEAFPTLPSPLATPGH